MGLLDFLKKKTSGAQQAHSYSTSNPSSEFVQISDMINFGMEWRERYINDYAIKNDIGVRVESLMYTCWFIWYNCMQLGKVSKEQWYVNKFFAHLMAHLRKDDKRFENVDFFMPLFQNRYSIFKDDLSGLINSHYPETKQYLPVRTYKAFYIKPTEILDVSSASLFTLTMEQDDELTSVFLMKFINFINEMHIAADRII